LNIKTPRQVRAVPNFLDFHSPQYRKAWFASPSCEIKPEPAS
jgi:hypothetical protein